MRPSVRFLLVLGTYYTLLVTPTIADDNSSTPQTTWSSYISQIYVTGTRPVDGSYDYRAVEEKAREVTKDNHGD